MLRIAMLGARKNKIIRSLALWYCERFVNGPFNRKISLKIDALHSIAESKKRG
mgnify:FL=1